MKKWFHITLLISHIARKHDGHFGDYGTQGKLVAMAAECSGCAKHLPKSIGGRV